MIFRKLAQAMQDASSQKLYHDSKKGMFDREAILGLS